MSGKNPVSGFASLECELTDEGLEEIFRIVDGGRHDEQLAVAGSGATSKYSLTFAFSL